MLLNLSGKNIFDIVFAFNCCAIYMFCPKHSHGEALKKIGQYLKLTRDRGLILNSNMELFNIFSYTDENALACMEMRSRLIRTVLRVSLVTP